jgi:hypothetical protein
LLALAACSAGSTGSSTNHLGAGSGLGIGGAGESRAELAYRLGIIPELLEQAEEERAEELLARGKLPRQLGRRAFDRSDYFAIAVTMPAMVHADWMEFYKVLRITPSALLRSLIEHFLVTSNVGGRSARRGIARVSCTPSEQRSG